MTKLYCDICGDPASDDNNRPRLLERRTTIQGKDAFITVRINFGFTKHPTGFGGPPDLCHKCMCQLIQDSFLLNRDTQVISA